jgi:hypothetical protein
VLGIQGWWHEDGAALGLGHGTAEDNVPDADGVGHGGEGKKCGGSDILKGLASSGRKSLFLAQTVYRHDVTRVKQATIDEQEQ